MNTYFLFLDIGGPELALILFVGLLLFGGDKLPELARGLGKGIRDFKDASNGVRQDFEETLKKLEEEKKETPQRIMPDQEEAMKTWENEHKKISEEPNHDHDFPHNHTEDEHKA